MKLFDLKPNLDTYCTFSFKDEEDIHMWDGLFQGDHLGKGLLIPKGMRREEDVDSVLPDFTNFALRPYPTFSERAIDLLGDLIRPYGEFAAIDMDEPIRYFAFNATTVVDVLDEGRSEISRFRSGGVMAVDRHILLESTTNLPPIFKIPQTRRNTIYVNDAFVAEVQCHKLIGFRFELLFEN